MVRSIRLFAAAFPLLLLSNVTIAQTASARAQKHVDVPAIAARAEDVGSVDGIMKAFYDVISGPAGQARQWSRDRSLYISDIRFVSMSENKAGHPVAHVVSHQQFVDASDASVVKEGFYESEIHRVTQKFGNIAHVFSTYESRVRAGGPVIGRGINSMELFYDGTRWWVASVVWDDERPDNPLPAKYLPGTDAPKK
jgi:hypothetical protein